MIQELKNLPLFDRIDCETLEHLIQEKQIYKRLYGKGATVHAQDTECSVMDMVCCGRLVAYSLTANGSETVVFEFGTGSIIGANLLFGGQNRYPTLAWVTLDDGHLSIWNIGIPNPLNFFYIYAAHFD